MDLYVHEKLFSPYNMKSKSNINFNQTFTTTTHLFIYTLREIHYSSLQFLPNKHEVNVICLWRDKRLRHQELIAKNKELVAWTHNQSHVTCIILTIGYFIWPRGVTKNMWYTQSIQLMETILISGKCTFQDMTKYTCYNKVINPLRNNDSRLTLQGCCGGGLVLT